MSHISPEVIFVEVLDSTSTQRWNIEVRVFQLKRSTKTVASPPRDPVALLSVCCF